MGEEVAALKAEIERLKAELAATARNVPKKRECIAEMSSEVRLIYKPSSGSPRCSHSSTHYPLHTLCAGEVHLQSTISRLLESHQEGLGDYIHHHPRASISYAVLKQVVDSNPYSRLMALKRMGIVAEYERIRDFSVIIVGLGGIGR